MSSAKRLWAVFVARNKEFLRDRGALAWNLMFPLFVVFGMAFAFNGKNQEVFKIGVAGAVESLPPGLAATKYVSDPGTHITPAASCWSVSDGYAA